jgi:hypothetical protein
VTDFDGLRCAVGDGDGVVARFPGVVCVAAGTHGQARSLLPALLDLCRESAGSAPGLTLGRRLAGWLGGLRDATEGLAFGTVAATPDDGLAVFLLGDMRVLIPELAVVISGTEAATWTDRLLVRPDAPVVLTAVGVENPLEAAGGVSDLRVGVVAGATAVLLHIDATPAPVAVTPLPARAEQPLAADVTPVRGDARQHLAAEETLQPADAVRPPAPVPAHREPSAGAGLAPSGPPAAPPRPVSPQRADLILGVPDDLPRLPLPLGRPGDPRGGEGAPTDSAQAPAAPQTRGHLCSRGHLNDPRSHFCVLCGIRMNERTGVLVVGTRPPLGLLVFENGATYTVDADYLIGRNPEIDERVRTGELRSIMLEDLTGAVSRAHAEVRLDGWDVTVADSGSSNGTFVAPAGQDWAALVPGEVHRLMPGTRVRLGDAVFVFESPSGVR